MTTVSATREILSTLWRDGQYAYLWTDNGKKSKWFKVDEPTAIPGEWKDSNVYFSIHPCASIPATNSRGEQVDASQVRSQIRLICAINCVFGEFDAKDEVNIKEYAAFLPDDYDELSDIAKKTAVKTAKEQAVVSDLAKFKARAFARIDKTPFPPTLIIDSGGGYHAYWMFTEPVAVTDANRTHVQAVQAVWVDLIGCDPVSKDLARVLRVPGTKNVKPQYAPNFPLVSVVKYAPEQACTFAQIEILTGLDELTTAAKQAQRKTKENDQDKPTDDVISEFNRTHRMVDMLIAQGYTLGWERPEVARLSRPGRDKSQTSVIVFKGGDKEMSYHHSSSDPLYTIGHCWDAFDIYTKTEHQGDAKAAYEAAKREQGKWTENKRKERKAIDPQTGEIMDLSEVTPTIHLNGNGSHNHTENAAKDGHAQSEEKASTVDALRYRAEDGGILDAWAEHYSHKWLFSVGKDRWYYWCGTHWALDESLMLHAEIRKLLDEMNHQCSEYLRNAPAMIEAINKRYISIAMPDSAIEEIENIQKRATIAKSMHMATKRTNGRIASIAGEGMARSVRAIPGSRLDISESINLKNGVLNLHSLELFPHNPDDLFTYCLPYEYDPDATCPLFEKFISEVLVKEDSAETDPQLVALFQELLGYSLTPQTKREVMIWMFGEGGNGKSVALSIVKALLGPMALSVDFQTLGMPGNYDLADIPGARVIFSTEAERGGHIAEGYIKKIVTGDPIKTRPIYGSPIDFCSTAKIWWAMNDKPAIKDTTDSIWRRMKLIPFYRKFEEGKNADVDLSAKLRAELPGILNWALRGLMRLTVNNRFTDAESANEAKKQYRDESNPVAQWVNTMTVRTSYPSTLQAALYTHFKGWCLDNGERPITSNQFGRDLKRLKVGEKRKTAGVFYSLALIEANERKNLHDE